jgi:hypothetical protein
MFSDAACYTETLNCRAGLSGRHETAESDLLKLLCYVCQYLATLRERRREQRLSSSYTCVRGRTQRQHADHVAAGYRSARDIRS